MNVETNDSTKCLTGLEGLYNVDDPEVGLNVVDLGLIYRLDFDEEAKKVAVTMTLTTQFCPMGDSITNNVGLSLRDSFPEWEIDVNLIFEPPWDFNKISPKGREFLGR